MHLCCLVYIGEKKLVAWIRPLSMPPAGSLVRSGMQWSHAADVDWSRMWYRPIPNKVVQEGQVFTMECVKMVRVPIVCSVIVLGGEIRSMVA